MAEESSKNILSYVKYIWASPSSSSKQKSLSSAAERLQKSSSLRLQQTPSQFPELLKNNQIEFKHHNLMSKKTCVGIEK